MITQHTSRTIDNIDTALLKELETDAAQSIAEIAEKLGISSTTAHRRLQRLLNQGIARIVAITDPLALGFHVQVTIGINVGPGSVDDVADDLALFDPVHHIIITTGPYDIIIWIAFRSEEELLDFIQNSLGHVRGVASIETMSILKMKKISWALLEKGNHVLPKESVPHQLDTLDINLIKELEINARQPHTVLAKKLGVARATVRTKIEKLLDEGTVSLVCISDPSALGYNTRAGFLLKVHPSRLGTVADELASDKRVQHVFISTGRFDIIAWADFQDAETMSSYIRKELGSIEGVLSHETVINLRIAKGSLKLLAGKKE